MNDQDKAQQLANYLAQAFAGRSEVKTFNNADNTRSVGIVITSHSDKVTYLGTLGGFTRQMSGDFFRQNLVRVELISAIEEKHTEDMSKLLASLIFRMDIEECNYMPQNVIKNVVRDSSTMKHIYLCDPFLWDNGMPSMHFDDSTIAFLYALPISETELAFIAKNGAEAFEDLLQDNDTPYFQWNRNATC